MPGVDGEPAPQSASRVTVLRCYSHCRIVVVRPSATAALDNLTVTTNALAKLFAGDTSPDTVRKAILGGGKREGGWFDRLQDKAADNPVARLDQKIGNWLYNRATGWGNQQPATNTSNVKVEVFVDSELVASKIMSAVEAALRLPGSSAGADGSANHMPPDSYNF